MSRFALLLLLFATTMTAQDHSQAAPHLTEQGGRFALFVDGAPFLVLGGQINNSSSWPATMPEVWPVIEGMHANTVEAPVYWEQMEPQSGKFDFSLVDMLVNQARLHHVYLDLLWFGTWKNGEDHYVPVWIKSDLAKYPRMIDEQGEPIQVLSANSPANLHADEQAFAALMRHLKQIDGTQHTVILVQVENESGAIGAVRDHSPLAEKQFEGQVPGAVLGAMHKSPGTWRQVFGPDADQFFQAYSLAYYVNRVAKAGKAEMQIPMYCNVWLEYPRGYQIRGFSRPGFDYPSGGPMQSNIAIWKAVAPNIDILAPDIYSQDRKFEQEIMNTYARSDNPLLIPETGLGNPFAPALFYALSKGAIGFTPFGTDQTSWTLKPGELPKAHAENYALLKPIGREVARLDYEGKLKTAVEEEGKPEEDLTFGRWIARVTFGFPQRDGRLSPPGTKDFLGRALVAQLGPDKFLVAGIEARVTFYLASGYGGHMQILSAEEGTYNNETWRPSRVWNGDQTDRGLNFHHEHQIVQIQLGTF